MNRELISKALSDIDTAYIAESMHCPWENTHRSPERTLKMGKYENTGKGVHSRRLISLILAACLVFTLAITAYAADIGGIQRVIQIWLYGNQTSAILVVQAGKYTLTDETGDVIRSGGGVAFNPDGSERPLTEDEIMAHLDSPELQYKEDGTVWVSYLGQKIEITDLFDVDGICYLELRDGEDVLYATVTKENGMAYSPNAYIQPSQFGVTKEE